ncbi:MAG: hypothetical protein JWQ33_1047 [Ramlibacter sp.]|nr:hypothetical protein [Ramlibacter sp.]
MNPLLAEGLTDAAGFVAGFLVALMLARLLGFDPMAPGYGSSAIAGMVMVGIGGGLGLQIARRWRASRKEK